MTTVKPLYKAYHTAAECLAYYGVPYKIREIQIHWWDDPKNKPSHDGVVEIFRTSKVKSVNYVASASKITKMVSEDMCAWTTQNGNPYGIKIECSPYGTDADYKAIGGLVAEIRSRRGNLPLVPHKKYFATACPGTLSLTRINEEANKGEDMYKGHNAKYWYDKYIASKSTASTYKALLQKIKSVLGIK